MAGFFNYSKPGKGIKKEDLDKSGVGLYFDIFGRRIWKFITLNLLYLFASIPAIYITYLIASYLLAYLLLLIQSNIPQAADIVQKTEDIVPIITVFVTGILFQIFGSGPATASMSYILRKYVKDTHVWLVSDFFEQIKKNFKQGIAVYIINTFAFVALNVAYIFYAFIMKNVIGDLLSVVIIVLSAFFVMMQMYIYQLMSGFDFKVKDLYKNSFLLTMIRLPFNLLVSIVVAILMYTMYSIVSLSPLVGAIVCVVVYIVLINYTQIFMTRNIIKEFVLEPSIKNEENTEK